MSRSRIEILTSERDRRIGEVVEYETGIEILIEALSVLAADPQKEADHVHAYKQTIEGLIDQNRIQMHKSKVALTALEQLIAKDQPKIEH